MLSARKEKVKTIYIVCIIYKVYLFAKGRKENVGIFGGDGVWVMIDHDHLFKELLSTFFVDFIELFLPDVMAYLEPDSVMFLDKEVFTDVTAGERYEADLLVQA